MYIKFTITINIIIICSSDKEKYGRIQENTKAQSDLIYTFIKKYTNQEFHLFVCLMFHSEMTP
jgi:hypothetical protein